MKKLRVRLGATVVSRHGGEMISELALAITNGLGASSLSSTVHPYPTRSEVWRRLGDSYQRTRLTPRVKWLLGRIISWRR